MYINFKNDDNFYFYISSGNLYRKKLFSTLLSFPECIEELKRGQFTALSTIDI